MKKAPGHSKECRGFFSGKYRMEPDVKVACDSSTITLTVPLKDVAVADEDKPGAMLNYDDKAT